MTVHIFQEISEGAFLRKAEARQSHALARLGDFYFHHGRIGSGDFRGSQHRELAEHFAVHLGDQKILAAGILAPNLSELYDFHSHV